jgi:protocatechuate 3,4-dioxygenase beta subunit
MMTDDHGEYRIFGLAPGTYYIAASMPAAAGRLTTSEEIEWAQQRPATPAGASPVPPLGPSIAFPATYYPGTTNVQQASAISLGVGEERRGIDLMLQPVMTARVTGRVTGHDGQPARAVQIVLTAVGARTSIETARQAAISDQNGAFELASVIPGQYTLSARGSTQPPPPPPAPPSGDVPFAAVAPSGGRTLDLWATAEITVSSQDVTGLAIALEPGLTISGRVAFDAATLVPPADFTRVVVMVMSALTASGAGSMPTNMHGAPVRADGTFQLAGIAPDNYVISGLVKGGGSPDMSWMVKSVTLGGENVADRPVALKPGARSPDVVITFTDRHAELSGRLVDTAGRPAPEYFVFVFSTNRSYWTPNAPRLLRPPTRPASDGTYRIAALPPGEYYVAALTEVDDADIYDAAFLEQVAAAAFKITIAEGEKKKQDLQIGGRG